MGNSFTFSRPRGIKGTYCVEITLDLLPTDTVVVSTRQSSPQSGQSSSQSVVSQAKAVERGEAGNGRLVVKYALDRIVAGDTIRIDIRGNVYDPLHCLVYSATMQGFAVKRVSWYAEVHTWLTTGNDLMPVDLDRQDRECPAVELRVLDVPHGFQTYRLAVNDAACEETPQKLLAELWALVAPQLPAKRLIGKE